MGCRVEGLRRCHEEATGYTDMGVGPTWYPIMENQTEKERTPEMESGVFAGAERDIKWLVKIVVASIVGVAISCAPQTSGNIRGHIVASQEVAPQGTQGYVG